MQTNDFSNLPTLWQIKTLGEVCVSTNSNITFKNIQDKKGDYPIYGASGVVAYVDFYTKENQSLGIVKDGAGIGRVFLLPPKASVIGTLHYVENNDNLNLKYLFYFLQSINLARYITGSAIPHIYFRDWKKEQIPLPPLEIQKRIVARLESAFEKIEKGSAHLQDAKTKLAKYKQSLLKSAFDGTLFCHTEGEARSISNQEFRDISLTLNMTNSPSLRANETSVAIQNNDTTKAIDCHKSANANFHNDDKSVDCHDLTSSKFAMTDKENPKLPQGWTIKTLGEVFKVVGGGTPSTAKTEFWNGNIAWITSADIDLQSFIITPKRFITNEAIQSSTTNCVENDTIIVVTRVGLGKVGITDRQTCFSQDSQALIPLENVNVKFMAFQIKNQAKNFISVSRGTTINGITKNTLKELKLVVPPLEIQKQIVKLLEKHLQHADKTGEFTESALNKAKQLKQSLLKSAFLGKLT